jgi:chromosome segregation ATPase
MSAASNGLLALQQLAAQFRYLTDFATELEGITSFETLATEAQTRAAAAKSDADAAQIEADKLKAEVSSLKSQADQIMNDANSYVATSESKADAKCKDMLDAARANADDINANANAIAQKLVADVGEEVTAAQNKLTELTGQVSEAESNLEQINADADAAAQRLQAIRDSINKFATA